MDAQRARGYEIERVQGGLIEQVRKVAPLIVPVTMNSILMGEDVVNAMDLRCFGIRARTWIQKLAFHWWDYAVIGFGVALLAASLIASLGFHIGGFWMPNFYGSG
jgi:energy-coupling factor transport system permease protein